METVVNSREKQWSVPYYSSAKASCGEARDIASLRRKMQAGPNIILFKIGEIGQHRRLADTLRQQFKHVRHANTHAAQARAPAT